MACSKVQFVMHFVQFLLSGFIHFIKTVKLIFLLIWAPLIGLNPCALSLLIDVKHYTSCGFH